MVIRFTLSIPMKRIKEVARLTELPSLPECITKRGPYVNNAEGVANQIIITYESEKTKLAEACQYIFKPLDVFQGVPGFTFSAHLLEEGKKVEEHRIASSKRRQDCEVQTASNSAPKSDWLC